MKLLLILLLSAFAQLTFASSVTCLDSSNSEGSYLGNQRGVWIQEALQEGRVREWRDGQIAWGDYVCQGCSNVRSMKPDINEQRICEGCGKPHTGEIYFEPAQIEMNGKVYLINARNFVTGAKEELAAKKDNWSCPFCVATNVVGKSDCPSCGASFQGQTKYLSDLAKAVSRYHSSNLNQPNQVAVASTTYNSTLPGKVVAKDLAKLKRLHGVAAASVIGVVLAGTVYYFHETHISSGKVVGVSGQEVQVEYQDKRLVIQMPEGRIPARIGESVSVHWSRRHGAIGVERENGGDFAAIQKTNGDKK